MLQCLLLSFKYWLLNSFSYAINRSNIGPIPIYLSSFSDINHNFFFLISANEKELALDTNSHKSSLSSFLFLDDKWMTDDKFQDFFVLPNLWKALFYKLFTTTLFVLFPTSTWTLYSHIICIICIYNITCISGFSRLGNIYIICIIRTIYIINISLLWTNCGHRPHPFTANIIPYFKVQ